jgi:hypothetical protein
MYHVLSKSENGNLGIKIDGKLTRDDYDLLIPYINRLRQEVGRLRLMWDMTECEGLDTQALWEDLTMQLHQFHEIPRVAVVGDRHWMECGTKVYRPLLKTTVKYFGPDQLDTAWTWVEGDET